MLRGCRAGRSVYRSEAASHELCDVSRLNGRRDALAPVIGPFLVVLLVVLIVRLTRS